VPVENSFKNVKFHWWQFRFFCTNVCNYCCSCR